MSNVVGYVQEISTKNGVGKRGPWTLYGVKVNDQWYGGGFDAPKFAQGDYVSFAVVERIDNKGNKKLDIDQTSVKKESPPQAASGQRVGSTEDRQASIVYQSSRANAIAAVDVLLKHDLIPLPTKAKKNEDAYQVVIDAINKLTVQFFNDAQSFRLFDRVADAGDLEEPEDAPETTEPEDAP